ncbi:protein kinase family protein [Oceanobacillus piezotolerans]|uniref:Protein kinase family protein n=1 Tax=Oceanobacillus piezotolerans TaxID=2448030 RepID=A0A498D314_9BACI|nr:serine/threonine-protein kinase [Oceanobacillus piezotolerans]RLL41670.1 protein kinase family protein [Oceanobacillus piezotolerans]
MKTQAHSKLESKLKTGTIIRGKWHQKNYRIHKKLGEGAIGTVYLCDVNGKLAALKISDKGTSMTLEVNVLKSLQQVQGSRLGPYLLDVDDWKSPSGKLYSFYVMEYVKGETITDFLKKHGSGWIGILLMQLLEDLERLHQSGWVFGDLKLDNLIVSSGQPRVRFVDVGGTTQLGRGIKEFTEFYDRGYWGMGTRRAEPSYDLFCLAMIMLHIYYPKRFVRGPHPEKILFKKLDLVKPLAPYREVLRGALTGKYRNSTEMKKELAKILHNRDRKTRRQNKTKKNMTAVSLYIELTSISFIAGGYYLLSVLIG